MTETTEGHVAFRDYRTWYRITGSLDSPRLPLVVAHGGPGCTHDYVDAFKDIAALDGRAVIHYDQLGNGNSTRLPDKGPDFWTVDLSSMSSTRCCARSGSSSATPCSASPGAACSAPSTPCAGRTASRRW